MLVKRETKRQIKGLVPSSNKQPSWDEADGTRQSDNLSGSTYFLQRYLGNSFLQSAVQREISMIQPKFASSGSCAGCAVKEEERKMQTKLTIGSPTDVYEQEADRISEQIMRMSDSSVQTESGPSSGRKIQRISKAATNNRELNTKVQLNRSGGRPLSPVTRQFMEPRFGVDFRQVRLHTDEKAQKNASQLRARAFVYGNHIWLGKGENENNKNLLAHELTHVIQQQTAGSEESIQRVTVEGNCTSSASPAEPEAAAESGSAESETILSGEAGIQQAWDRARELVSSTLEILGRVRTAMREEGGPARFMPSITMLIRKTFGDVGGGLDGGSFTRIGSLIRKMETIRSTLVADAYTIRCAASSDTRCGSYLGAFVVNSIPDVIFVCPDRFFAKGLEQRAETLIHELAHSELGATHAGIGGLTEDVTLPPMAYDCSAEGFGLDYDTALDNAYAYDTLIACLVGSHPTSSITATGGAPHAEDEEAHTANEIGAFLLIPSSGGAGAEVRYTRALLGHAPGWEFYGVAGASYLSHGDTFGLGLGIGLRYAWPWLFLQGGVGVEGSAALSPGHGSSPALNVGGVAEAEAGVDLGVIRLSGGYRLIVPLTGPSALHPEHVGTLGVSVDF